jgi:hypothetical protein
VDGREVGMLWSRNKFHRNTDRGLKTPYRLHRGVQVQLGHAVSMQQPTATQCVDFPYRGAYFPVIIRAFA